MEPATIDAIDQSGYTRTIGLIKQLISAVENLDTDKMTALQKYDIEFLFDNPLKRAIKNRLAKEVII